MRPIGRGRRKAVTPRTAATVALVRPGPSGLEVLLIERPTTMAFAAGVHAFPGGAVDPDDGMLATGRVSTAAARGDAPVHRAPVRVAAVRELFEECGVLLADRPSSGRASDAALEAARAALVEGTRTFADVVDALGVRLRTDRLVPLSRWITPRTFERRFDTSFFAAELPSAAAPSFHPAEVAGHRWLRPADALSAMAGGEITLWPPTSSTLQQLRDARSFDEIASRLGPSVLDDAWTGLPPDVAPLVDGLVRIAFAAAGGVAGQRANGWLVGRRELLVIDPGDPGDAAASAVLAAGGRGTRIAAIVLTQASPDHAAGVSAIVESLGGLPVFAGPGARAELPYAVRELGDGETVPAGDELLVAVHAPGHRADHLVLHSPRLEVALSGDLVGEQAARSIPPPPDLAAWRRSLERLGALGARLLLPGHGEPIADVPAAIAAEQRRLSRAAAPRRGSG